MTWPRLERVVCRPVSVPVDPPLQSSAGEIAAASLLLVDVADTDGAIGHAYIICYIPAALAAAHAMAIHVAEALAGGPAAPRAAAAALPRRMRDLGRDGVGAMVMGGIDMALWDLAARRARVPLALLLGADPVPVRAYASLRSASAAQVTAEAAKASADGFAAVKVKIGHGSAETDAAAVAAVRDGAGDDVIVMADYNQALSVPEAIVRARMLADLGVYWMEEPTSADDPGGHARITRASRVPVQLGENWQGPREVARSIAVGGSNLAMLNVMKIGGVTGWLSAAALAGAAGLPVSSHLFPQISAHLLAATPGRDWLEWQDLAGPVLADPPRPTRGMLAPSATPGSGVAWDEQAVSRWQCG